MCNPDTDPLRKSSGTTAGTAATWRPLRFAGSRTSWVRPADGANEEILLGGLRARIAI